MCGRAVRRALRCCAVLCCAAGHGLSGNGAVEQIAAVSGGGDSVGSIRHSSSPVWAPAASALRCGAPSSLPVVQEAHAKRGAERGERRQQRGRARRRSA
eukprot:scaffold523_cov446-Prasinococcus_capsulatus_cf.AAC.15